MAHVYRESAQDPAQLERKKRQSTEVESYDKGKSTFIEASILMNVRADEFVAVAGVVEEDKSQEGAKAKLEAKVAALKEELVSLGFTGDAVYADFVAQSRVYGFEIGDNIVTEIITGFEVKKNVSVRFQKKEMIDVLLAAAAKAGIYDLVKIDYVVTDAAAIQEKLRQQTAEILRSKADYYRTALGMELPAPTQVVVDKPSVYFPVEQYASYTASESEEFETSSNSRISVRNARKVRTSYFQPLSGEGFDLVINPVIVEPVVQFTTYLKVRYQTQPSEPDSKSG